VLQLPVGVVITHMWVWSLQAEPVHGVSDVTIAWLDNSDGQPNAVDYFITERAQVGGWWVWPWYLILAFWMGMYSPYI